MLILNLAFFIEMGVPAVTISWNHSGLNAGLCRKRLNAYAWNKIRPPDIESDLCLKWNMPPSSHTAVRFKFPNSTNRKILYTQYFDSLIPESLPDLLSAFRIYWNYRMPSEDCLNQRETSLYIRVRLSLDKRYQCTRWRTLYRIMVFCSMNNHII